MDMMVKLFSFFDGGSQTISSGVCTVLLGGQKEKSSFKTDVPDT